MGAALLQPNGCQDRPAVIDAEHLGRITLGDRALEREVLQIFVRQVGILLARISAAEPPLAAASAHTLLGSARGIGACRVAAAAERLELAASKIGADDLDEAIAGLRAASLEATAAIGERLGAASLAPEHDTRIDSPALAP